MKEDLEARAKKVEEMEAHFTALQAEILSLREQSGVGSVRLAEGAAQLQAAEAKLHAVQSQLRGRNRLIWNLDARLSSRAYTSRLKKHTE